jgi:hypothetical protein
VLCVRFFTYTISSPNTEVQKTRNTVRYGTVYM